MFMITTLKNQRAAIEDYVSKHNVDTFEYDGLVGFDAFDYFLTCNEAFELEFVCAYLDQQNGIQTDYPELKIGE